MACFIFAKKSNEMKQKKKISKDKATQKKMHLKNKQDADIHI